MMLMRHRLPAVRAGLELKMLSSVVDCCLVVVISGGMVVGIFFTEKAFDLELHSFKVNTIVRFSPAERRPNSQCWCT